MEVKRRHRLTFFLLRPFFRLFIRLKFNYKAIPFERQKALKGPYLILSNHTQESDPFFVSLSFKGPIYYVASDMIFSIKVWSSFIKFLVSPIPKTKYRSDLATIRDIKKMVKSGGSIGLFPEGNASFSGDLMPISPAVSKLIKLLKIPVIFYHIEGGYTTKPRWSKTIRKGSMQGRVVKVWTPEAYLGLSVESIQEVVETTLTVNEADYIKDKLFKGKDFAEDIESTFFVCPNCKEILTLSSINDQVSCRHCELLLTVDAKNRLFTTQSMHYFDNTVAWYQDQYTVLEQKLRDMPSDTEIFSDSNENILSVERASRKNLLGEGIITLMKTGLRITYDKQEEFWEIADIMPAVQQKNKLILHHRTLDKTLYCISHPKRNALKYVLAIETLQKEGLIDGI